jgi:hypothetical protein
MVLLYSRGLHTWQENRQAVLRSIRLDRDLKSLTRRLARDRASGLTFLRFSVTASSASTVSTLALNCSLVPELLAPGLFARLGSACLWGCSHKSESDYAVGSLSHSSNRCRIQVACRSVNRAQEPERIALLSIYKHLGHYMCLATVFSGGRVSSARDGTPINQRHGFRGGVPVPSAAPQCSLEAFA